MAGGVGTGLFLIAKCACCDFESMEEIDFVQSPTDQDITGAKDWLKKQHFHRTHCDATVAYGIEQTPPTRRQGNYTLPASAQALLIR